MKKYKNTYRLNKCFLIQQMRNNIESHNQLSSDQIQLGISPNIQVQNPNQNPPNHIAPIFYVNPNNNNQSTAAIIPLAPQNSKNYEVSYMKAEIFIFFALIPIIWIGVIMGTCQTKYRTNQICYGDSTSYYDYYSNYYYGYSTRLTQTQCCSIYKIVFGVWVGLFLGYLLVNILVLAIAPPSMSNYFINILLYSRVGESNACCPNSCQAILYILFFPILSVVAIVSGIVYLVVRCLEIS